jgi:hypothetical protein
MVVMFVDCCVGGGWYFLYYSYCTFPWDGESAQLKKQLINNVRNKEKITLKRPTIFLPIAEWAIKTLGVTNCVDFFEEICSITPRQRKDVLLHRRRPESGLAM